MAQPYPITRATRDEAVNVGSGVASYGPFGFKIFDVDDVKVYTRPVSGGNWAPATVTVTKTAGLAFDTFSIAFSTPIGSDTQYKVLGARVYERSAGVTSGTRLDPDALEKELSKIATTLQELRRDLDRSVQVRFGPGYSMSDDLVDGDTLMKSGDSLVAGPNSADISSAQSYAEAAGNSATAAGNSASAAGTARTDAETARDLAQKFATHPEDSVVTGGLYSAFHWAQKAAAVVLAGLIDLSVTTAKIANGAVTQAKLAADIVSGWSAKSSMADADQFLIGDSAASNVAKKLTLANLITSIFNGTRAIANVIVLTATLKWRNASGFDLTHDTTGLTANRQAKWPNRAVDLGNVYAIPSVKSGQFTATLGGRLQFPHGLGTTPPAERLFASIINTSGAANLGYDNGTELVVTTDQTGSASGRGIQVWADSTYIYGQVGNTALAYLSNGTTGAGGLEPTVANWKVYLGVS